MINYPIAFAILVAFVSQSTSDLSDASAIISAICGEIASNKEDILVENRYCHPYCFTDSKNHTVILLNDCEPKVKKSQARQQYYHGTSIFFCLKMFTWKPFSQMNGLSFQTIFAQKSEVKFFLSLAHTDWHFCVTLPVRYRQEWSWLCKHSECRMWYRYEIFGYILLHWYMKK